MSDPALGSGPLGDGRARSSSIAASFAIVTPVVA
jgi:hypothetical protein